MEIPLFTGFRFSPNDSEIVNHYLKRKVLGLPFCADFMVDVDDLAWRDPCSLPGVDRHRYFFSKKLRNVVTRSRYWTPMGQEMGVLDPVSNEVVGVRRSLALAHTDGKMPLPLNQSKSFWFMHEYRLAATEMLGTGQQEWAAYHVFHKEIKTNAGINLQLHSETDESGESDDEGSDYGENGEEENDAADMPDFIDHIGQAEDSSGFCPPPPDSP